MKPNKLAILTASFFLAGFLILSSHAQVQAGGAGPGNLDVSAAPSSLQVGHTSTISLFTYYSKCSDGNTYGSASECAGTVVGKVGGMGALYISVSGGGTLSSITPITDSSGNGSVTLSSTVAGVKTVNIYSQNGSGGPDALLGSLSVTFTAAVTAPVPHVIKPTSAPVTAVAAPAPPVVPVPTVNQIKVGGKVVPSNQPVAVETRQPLVLSGKAVANGKITLYIHSKLRTVMVNADKDGVWQYALTNLPVGKHHIDVQVTDPATNKQSDKTALLDFSVKPSKTIALAAAPKSSFPLSMVAVPVVVALIVIGLAAFAWYKLRHGRKSEAEFTDLNRGKTSNDLDNQS